MADAPLPDVEQMLEHCLRWLANVEQQAGRDAYLDAMPNNGLGVAAMADRLAELRERDELIPGSERWRRYFVQGEYEGIFCDWGYCWTEAVTLRNTYQRELGWLPVCEEHRLATRRARRDASWRPPTPA
jgi:hypothetical protein